MKVEFTQELIDKLKHYCKVNAINILRAGKDNNKVKYYTEDALSDLMDKWTNKNNRGGWDKKNFTDNFYFISCKNFVLNSMKREETFKHKVINDFDNVPLDYYRLSEEDGILPFQMVGYDLNDPTAKEKDAKMQERLEFVASVLTENEWINQFDTDLFVFHFIEGKTLKEFKDEYPANYRTIGQSKKKIINIINYLWNKE